MLVILQHDRDLSQSLHFLSRGLERMKSIAACIAAAALLVACNAHAEDRCTAILVGPKASTAGTPMTTHTADCASCDFRIAKVPAQTHEEGAIHNVFLIELGYPRYVGDLRGDVYKHEHLDKRLYNWSETQPIGSIPEVRETYGYIDGVYGIINEHQLAMGESTCGGRFFSKPAKHGGQALFDIAALSRVAMQRTKTAREAIALMGDLAVKHGYYGAEWEGAGVYSEAGEALTIADPTEAWMFHILPDDTGASAIWAAQRVPDDHVSVVANAFVIHEVDIADTDNFMASANLFEVAIRNKIWQPDSGVPFDFASVYSEPPAPGPVKNTYSNRRVWRVLTLANPTVELSPDAQEYPFSVKASRVLSPHDVMRFHRDHYEGTPYDMTQGAPGGPYGDPDRYDPGVNGDLTAEDLKKGHFERAISIFRASYSFISVLDPSNPENAYLWFGQYAPHATVYSPVYPLATRVPRQFSDYSLFAFDKQSSFWASALVGNWAARFYKYAHPLVEDEQLRLEQAAASAQAAVTQRAAEIKQSGGVDAMRAYLTEQADKFAATGVASFAALFERLVTVFHDGYEMTNLDGAALQAKRLFYPKWWLQLVGYFTTQPAVDTSGGGMSYTTGAVAGLVGVVIGAVLGRRTAHMGGKRATYKPIQ